MPLWLGILIFCFGMFLIFLLSKLSEYLSKKSRRKEGQSQVSDENNLRIDSELLRYEDKKLSTLEKKFRERKWQITEKEGEKSEDGKIFVTKEIIDRAFVEVLNEELQEIQSQKTSSK